MIDDLLLYQFVPNILTLFFVIDINECQVALFQFFECSDTVKFIRMKTGEFTGFKCQLPAIKFTSGKTFVIVELFEVSSGEHEFLVVFHILLGKIFGVVHEIAVKSRPYSDFVLLMSFIFRLRDDNVVGSLVQDFLLQEKIPECFPGPAPIPPNRRLVAQLDIR